MMFLSQSAVCSRILEKFQMEMTETASTVSWEYKGTNFGTVVEWGRAQGRQSVSLLVLDWELTLSQHSHPTGFHVLRGYSQQLCRKSDNAYCVAVTACSIICKEFRKSESWLVQLHPDQRWKTASLQGLQRIASVIWPGISGPESQQGLYDSDERSTARLAFVYATFGGSVKH